MVREHVTQEVELVDVAVDADTPPTAGASRLRGWWAVVGLVVTVLALAVVQHVMDARADAATARLAAVPGVLDPPGEELEVVRLLGEAESRSFLTSVPVADGAWASVRVREDGSQAFTATELTSGAALWSTPVAGPDAARAAGREKSTGGECLADPASVPTWAVCTITDGSTDPGQDLAPATTTRVAVLDTRDGHLLADWEVEPDAQIGVLPGQVLVGLRRGGDITIVAHDARTGVERWRHEAAPRANTSVPAGSWSFTTAGDVVAYLDGVTLTVLSADGAIVRTDLSSPLGDGLGTDPGTGLPTLWARSTGDAQILGTTTLLARDADPAGDRVLPGRILTLTVDDGSLPGLVLTATGGLSAWDAGTSRLRWERDLLPGFGAIVVRGRVFTCSGSSVVALDGDTGDQVWEADAPSCSFYGLLTDGHDLLLRSITTGTTGPGGVTGYDFATGAQTRRLGLPPGVVELGTYRDRLLGYSRTFEQVAVLR